MSDLRLDRMARTITDYCLGLKKGDLLRIDAASVVQPLVRAVYAHALQAGANILTRIDLEGMAEILYRYATGAQLEYIADSERTELDTITARLFIGGRWNPRNLSGVDPQKLAIERKARQPLAERLAERRAKGEVRTCITHYPTHSGAQLAEMALDEYEDFIFGAVFADRPDPVAEWRKLSAFQQLIADRLEQIRHLRVEAADTELELSVNQRHWINSDGKANFPSGEIFTAPVEDSVNGTIRFEFPAIYSGQEVSDIRLRLTQGKVVEASATQGAYMLKTMLATDDGASRFGEVAFGTNPNIQRFTRNILFDEKIGGTMHFALGSAYPECRGLNKSAIHWDLIKDLRTQGRVFADGALIFENGKFT
jgi:aminopeptidase